MNLYHLSLEISLKSGLSLIIYILNIGRKNCSRHYRYEEQCHRIWMLLTNDILRCEKIFTIWKIIKCGFSILYSNNGWDKESLSYFPFHKE
uniref:Ovule protein n=1 Tax=Romanomermis culicivorax TaxID=13658 RepID=A0A915L2C4_ROMCU